MLFEFGNKSKRFLRILTEQQPVAEAEIRGGSRHPSVRGTASFYRAGDGVLVAAELAGLPRGSGACDAPVLGFHIHSEGKCSGDASDPFADAGAHYNPGNCPHPHHAGDLPPLFSNGGFAWFVFYTERFRAEDIVGKSVIVHDSPDDFRSQPAGDSGARIACGVIRRNFWAD
jgi:Cu-Zn family superoxide dismutase